MTDHAKLSPSSAHRWLTCTASVAATKDAPRTDSPESLEGTVAHALAAALLGAPSRDALAAKTYIKRDPKWAAPVQEYVRYVRAIEGVRHVEMRCDLSVWMGEGQFGTADAVIWDVVARHLSVIDLKFGRGVLVSARNNPQLRLYALGAVTTLREIPQRVTMTIHQPRRSSVQSETLDWHALQAWGFDTLVPAVREFASAPVYRPSESACHWCPAKSTCAARAAYGTQLIGDFFK